MVNDETRATEWNEHPHVSFLLFSFFFLRFFPSPKAREIAS